MMYTGELAALGAAVCWVMCALAFTEAGKHVGSVPVSFLRLLMAGLMFAAYGLAFRGLPLPTDATARQWGILAASGVVGFFIGDICLFRAFLLIGPRLALLVVALAPVIAALVAWPVLGEHLTPLSWLGMAVTLGGVAWVVQERRDDQPQPRGHRAAGVALAVVGAAGQGVGMVLSKLGMRDYDPFAASQIRLLAAVVCFVLTVTAIRRWPQVVRAVRHRRAMRYLWIGAFTGPFLGVGLQLTAVQHTLAGVAATIMATSPVLILPAVIVLYKEKVSARAWLGAALAVGGIALLVVGMQR